MGGQRRMYLRIRCTNSGSERIRDPEPCVVLLFAMFGIRQGQFPCDL
ncbi:hypothetical protein X975_15760, partial [Stegodyphus mimosarum]